MLKILVLVCPMAVDHAHCDRDTAVDVVQSLRVMTAQQCGYMAQTMIAPTAVAPEAGRQYLKIICLRESTAVALAKP